MCASCYKHEQGERDKTRARRGFIDMAVRAETEGSRYKRHSFSFCGMVFLRTVRAGVLLQEMECYTAIKA